MIFQDTVRLRRTISRSRSSVMVEALVVQRILLFIFAGFASLANEALHSCVTDLINIFTFVNYRELGILKFCHSKASISWVFNDIRIC